MAREPLCIFSRHSEWIVHAHGKVKRNTGATPHAHLTTPTSGRETTNQPACRPMTSLATQRSKPPTPNIPRSNPAASRACTGIGHRKAAVEHTRTYSRRPVNDRLDDGVRGSEKLPKNKKKPKPAIGKFYQTPAKSDPVPVFHVPATPQLCATSEPHPPLSRYAGQKRVARFRRNPR